MRKTRCTAAPAPRFAVCVLLIGVEFLLRSQIKTDVHGLTCKHDAHVRLFQSAVNSNFAIHENANRVFTWTEKRIILGSGS
jgi:hypothetical protein